MKHFGNSLKSECLCSPFVEGFSEPVTPLGCWRIAPDDISSTINAHAADNNPGWCMEQCFPTGQTGYVAMDMSNTSGSDAGFCSCMAGSQYQKDGAEPMGCTEMCGGQKQVFPGYLCGSTTAYVGSFYQKRGGKIGH